ncbi:hypothetical protein Agub_g201 [Astrephomene gubernaculifera]|uniref:Uncharacterized protein n=1 Tax=Astrephomene gubernaculifera TaxID=47775 RepID=A0AAD3DDG0_9CHLO|nr:hypothetical protein Agub_g201 [Astrephomene gubernaculifera]
MALSAVVGRRACVTTRPAIKPNPVAVSAIPSRKVTCRSQMLATLAAVGDVDAPIGVVVGAAIVISLAATALVPLALNPGQQAANKIFSATEKAPLDKKPSAPAKKSKK